MVGRLSQVEAPRLIMNPWIGVAGAFGLSLGFLLGIAVFYVSSGKSRKAETLARAVDDAVPGTAYVDEEIGSAELKIEGRKWNPIVKALRAWQSA